MDSLMLDSRNYGTIHSASKSFAVFLGSNRSHDGGRSRTDATAGYLLCAQTPGGINRAPAQGLLDHDTNVFALNTFREGLTVRQSLTGVKRLRGRNSRNLPRVILIEVMRVALPQIQIALRH